MMTIDPKARRQVILDAAARLIIQYGYDKTTISDIADATGLNRGLVYAHFKSKDDVLEALIGREMRAYSQLWIEHILADPRGGTVASIHRGIAYALEHNPFMAAIVTRDKDTFGKYLRKPGNSLAAARTPSLTQNLLRALQEAGAIRQTVNIPAVAYIMDLISSGLVERSQAGQSDDVPALDELLETLAEMYDCMLTPAEGGDLEAGKRVLQQFAAAARAHFEPVDRLEK